MRNSTAVLTIHLRHRIIVLAIVLLGLLSFVVLVRPTPVLLFVTPVLIVIELERKGYYGICPTYSLRIQGDGQVRYEGQRFVKVEGMKATRITPGQVQRLVTAFENIHFSTLPDLLLYGIEDLEESRTCLTWGETRKCVEIRSTYPAAELTELAKVKELNDIIDRTVQAEQWMGTREQIIEQRR